MERVLYELPMILFTTLAPMASGAFIGLAIAFATARFSESQLARIDRWTVLPLAILAAGFLAAFVFFASPQNIVNAFRGIGDAAVAFQFIMGMLTVTLAVVYWVIAMSGGLPNRPRTVFASVVGASAVLFSLAIGIMYMGSDVVTWSSPLVPLGIMGFCVAGGVPLGTLVVSLAGALPETAATRFGSTALVVALVGAVAATVSVSAQLLFAQSAFGAYVPGGDVLPGSWVYLLVAIVGFIVMLACLRGAVSLDGRSAAPLGSTASAAMPRGAARTAARTDVRSATALLVLGNVAVLAAIAVARMMFYALQL